MTESKHKHARVKDDRPRTSAGRLVVVALVLAALVAYWLVAGGSEEQDDPADTLTRAARTGAAGSTEWIAKDGSAYRMTVSSNQFVNVASASGCITVPAPGRTNLQFTVLIENRSPTAAPVPALEFAANVTGAGAVDTALTSFAKASRRIELVPLVSARTCEEASRIDPAGREKIEPGSSASFTGTLAGVKTPLGGGLSLIVRFLKADAGSGSGASEALVMVPVTR